MSASLLRKGVTINSFTALRISLCSAALPRPSQLPTHLVGVKDVLLQQLHRHELQLPLRRRREPDTDAPIASPSRSQDWYLKPAPGGGYLVSLDTHILSIRCIKMKRRNPAFVRQHQDYGGGSITVSGKRGARECVYVG